MFTQRISKVKLANLCSIFPKEIEKHRKTNKSKYSHQIKEKWRWQTDNRVEMAYRTICHYRQLMNNWYNNFTVWGEDGRQAGVKARGRLYPSHYVRARLSATVLVALSFSCSNEFLKKRACQKPTRVHNRGYPLCPFYTWSLSQLHCVGRADRCIIEKSVANAQFTAKRRIHGKL